MAYYYKFLNDYAAKIKKLMSTCKATVRYYNIDEVYEKMESAEEVIRLDKKLLNQKAFKDESKKLRAEIKKYTAEHKKYMKLYQFLQQTINETTRKISMILDELTFKYGKGYKEELLDDPIFKDFEKFCMKHGFKGWIRY